MLLPRNLCPCRWFLLTIVLTLLGPGTARAQSADSTRAAIICFIRADEPAAASNAEPLYVSLLAQPQFLLEAGAGMRYRIRSVGEVRLLLVRQAPAAGKLTVATDSREQVVQVPANAVVYLLYEPALGRFKPIGRDEALPVLRKIRNQREATEQLAPPPPPSAPVAAGADAAPTPVEHPDYALIHFIRSTSSNGANCRTSLTLPNQREFPLSIGSVVNYRVYSEGEVTITLDMVCPLGYRSAGANATQLTVKLKRGEDHYVLFHAGTFTVVALTEAQPHLSRSRNVMKQEENLDFPINRGSLREAAQRAGKGQSTCFLVSAQGYLVTNNHCVENSTTLKVRGINGDFATAHAATIVAKDPSNDLALIRLTDATLTFAPPPYQLRTTSVLQAERVYALGFPVAEALGNEIKITEGIISARSGLHGDVSKFQISAAVNPGNSGGPLIDENGSLIGVVYAKMGEIDATGYAVKALYLDTFLKSVEAFPYPTFTDRLAALKLPQKVAELQKCIFLLEAE